MSRKHPWMAMKDAMVEYRRRYVIEGRGKAGAPDLITGPFYELLAAGQPDHRQDDGDAVDREHDEGRLLDGLGDVEREFGEPQGSNDGHEQDKADRQDHRE